MKRHTHKYKEKRKKKQKQKSQELLSEREKIIQSHKIFCNFLDTNIINALIHLFVINSNTNENIPKIVKYIEEERKLRGLDSNVIIESLLYGENKDNSTLILTIKKNNIKLLHFSIHLCVRSLNSKQSGIIHFHKNIYKTKKQNTFKKINDSQKKGLNISKMLHVLINVKKRNNNPNSLLFFIADDSTPGPYDTEIQAEMDVVITVLNGLFDETNKQFYIGNTFLHIHNKTNNVLKNINKYNKHVSRKNKGTRIFPLSETNKRSIVNYKGKTQRKNRNKIILTNENLKKLNIERWNL